MAGFLRCLFGLVLLPLCWGFLRTLVDVVAFAAENERSLTADSIALVLGMASFGVCWTLAGHPVRAYVFGHELTHALWGILFGGRASDLRVGLKGGSVRLTKSNFVVSLAPYFFPFYTFVVIVVAGLVAIVFRRLPCLPAWLFCIGFTWSFHILFTLSMLSHEQPDVQSYGRLFSWAVIFLANTGLVLVWLAATTEVTFPQLGRILAWHATSAYLGIWRIGRYAVEWLYERTVK